MIGPLLRGGTLHPATTLPSTTTRRAVLLSQLQAYRQWVYPRPRHSMSTSHCRESSHPSCATFLALVVVSRILLFLSHSRRRSGFVSHERLRASTYRWFHALFRRFFRVWCIFPTLFVVESTNACLSSTFTFWMHVGPAVFELSVAITFDVSRMVDFSGPDAICRDVCIRFSQSLVRASERNAFSFPDAVFVDIGIAPSGRSFHVHDAIFTYAPVHNLPPVGSAACFHGPPPVVSPERSLLRVRSGPVLSDLFGRYVHDTAIRPPVPTRLLHVLRLRGTRTRLQLLSGLRLSRLCRCLRGPVTADDYATISFFSEEGSAVPLWLSLRVWLRHSSESAS